MRKKKTKGYGCSGERRERKARKERKRGQKGETLQSDVRGRRCWRGIVGSLWQELFLRRQEPSTVLHLPSLLVAVVLCCFCLLSPSLLGLSCLLLLLLNDRKGPVGNGLLPLWTQFTMAAKTEGKEQPRCSCDFLCLARC